MTREEIEVKSKRRGRLLAGLMLLILLGSTAGYAFLADDSDQQSTAGTVQNQEGLLPNGRWSAKIGDQFIEFEHSPAETAAVDLSITKTLQHYAGQRVYVDAESDSAGGELGATLGRYAYILPACYGSCTKDLPEVNCTGTSEVIVWKRAEDNRVYEEDKCVFIEGDLRGVDAFVYRVMGVQ